MSMKINKLKAGKKVENLLGKYISQDLKTIFTLNIISIASITFRSIHQEVFRQKAVIKNFA